MYNRMGNRRGAAWTEVELGVLDAEQGRLGSAAGGFERARRTYEQIGDRSGIARYFLESGRLALIRGEAGEARSCLEEALSRYTDLGAAQVAEVRRLLDR
ncbi:hypothetical protein [Streptomyces sp. NPDC057690]|uniref:hypothetical protein n=1 Tax=Streptomyces sp. NPDC057690 TaxID=3346214 RepID=UPI00369F6D7A